MDKLERYRSCIQTLLEKHSQFKSRNEEVENDLICLGLHPLTSVCIQAIELLRE